MHSLVLLLALFSADVTKFGAAGDGLTDDTAAIQRAADDCTAKLKTSQPVGGSYQGTCPELYFPSGRYKISSQIELNPYQSVRGEDSEVIQVDSRKIFVFQNCYRNTITRMQFLGGSTQLWFQNANTDMTRLVVDTCTFQGWTDVCVSAEGTGPDQHMSANLILTNCIFDGAQILTTRCDSTSLTSCRHQFRGKLKDGMCSMVNMWKGGVLHLNDFTGTPAMTNQVKVHWVDNYGSVVIDGGRFGGEGQAGLPIVHDHGPPNLVNPWKGRKIVIANTQTSVGKDVSPDAALLTLFGLPQCISIVNNDAIVSGTIPLIKVGAGYNVDADVAAVTAQANTSLGMYSITFRGNQYFAPTPMPKSLQQFVK